MGLGAYHTAHHTALLVVGTLEITLTLVRATMAVVGLSCTPRGTLQWAQAENCKELG